MEIDIKNCINNEDNELLDKIMSNIRNIDFDNISFEYLKKNEYSELINLWSDKNKEKTMKKLKKSKNIYIKWWTIYLSAIYYSDEDEYLDEMRNIKKRYLFKKYIYFEYYFNQNHKINNKSKYLKYILSICDKNDIQKYYLDQEKYNKNKYYIKKYDIIKYNSLKFYDLYEKNNKLKNYLHKILIKDKNFIYPFKKLEIYKKNKLCIFYILCIKNE